MPTEKEIETTAGCACCGQENFCFCSENEQEQPMDYSPEESNDE